MSKQQDTGHVRNFGHPVACQNCRPGLRPGVQCGSGDSLILVDYAAEDRLSANRSVERDAAGGVVVGWAVIAALVRSMMVHHVQRVKARR